MIIDCDSCAVRGLECHDCVVSVLLGTPPVAEHAPEGSADLDLDGREQAAIAVLAGSGLIPPLRLVPTDMPRTARTDATDPRSAPTRRAAAG